MCGIVGVLGNHEVAPIIVEALKRLEYRGYDSAGIATVRNGNGRAGELCCLRACAPRLVRRHEAQELAVEAEHSAPHLRKPDGR